MGRLIDDLLSLSRIELNEHIPPSGRCDLSLAVADVVDALAPLAQEKDVSLDLRLRAAGEAVVIGDRDQIVQVVQNLVDNAVKYAPRAAPCRWRWPAARAWTMAQAARSRQSARRRGGRRAAAAAVARPRGRPAASPMLTVTDTGPGMEREHLPRLSERFYRVEGQKSGERAGTGLGLAIVKHIVNRHRGGLIVESAPGRGSMFTAYFPMPAAEAAAA